MVPNGRDIHYTGPASATEDIRMRIGTARFLAVILALTACGDSQGVPDDTTDAGQTADAASDALAADSGNGLDASADDPIDEPEVAAPRCLGPVQRYDLHESTEVLLWPDAIYEVADLDSPTGVRLDVVGYPWSDALPSIVDGAVDAFGSASGFAALGGAFFTFSDRLEGLPASPEVSIESEAYLFYDLGQDPPARVPFEAYYTVDETSIVLQPVRPLRQAGEYLVVVTSAAVDEDGNCAQRAPLTESLLRGDSEDYGAITTRWLDALEAADLDPAEVSAMTTFTVHAEGESFVEIIESMREADLAWNDDAVCTVGQLWRRCDVTHDALDFRAGGGAFASPSVGSHAVPVRIWLPLDDSAPATPIVFGHGANTTRNLGALVADVLAPQGFAVIAADALEHGDHPYRTGDDPDNDFPRMLGLDLGANLGIDASKLKASFNQTVLEWVQLTELVALDGDPDGDGTPDWATTRIAYAGFSLGGMMGAGVVALSDRIDAAVLSITGGELLTFITANPQVKPFVPALEFVIGGEDAFDRFAVIAQSAVDAADPAAWGAHILSDRLTGEVPHVLFPTTIHDEVVAPASATALAIAMGIPHGRPIVEPIPALEVVDTPARANLDGVTAVFMQFDQTTLRGEVVSAGHSNLPRTDEALQQMVHFFTTWRDESAPEVIVPVP